MRNFQKVLVFLGLFCQLFAMVPNNQDVLAPSDSFISIDLFLKKSNDSMNTFLTMLHPDTSNPPLILLDRGQMTINLSDPNDYSKVQIQRSNMLFYYGKIGIGSPSNTFGVVFDTGSFYLTIDSVLCKDDVDCTSHKQYDESTSSTFKDSNDEVDYIWRYGTASVRARRGYENFYLSNYEIGHFEFYQIVEQINLMVMDRVDGVVGLGRPYEDRVNKKTNHNLIDVLKEKNLIEKNLIAFNIKRKDDSKSTMTIGGYRASDLGSPINWMKNAHPNYWLVKLEKFYFGDESNNICKNDCVIMLDTGTTLISAPGPKLDILRSQMKGFTCKDFSKLPDLTIVMGGVSYKMTPSEYIIGIKDYQLYYFEQPEELDNCSGIFMQIDIKYEDKYVFIVGNIFLSKFVSLFDKDNDRVGLAYQA